MNKFMNINPGRFATILGVFALALVLTACGGGGDGGTAVPTPSTPATGTLTASGCTVPDGASACNAQASWSTQNATSPRLTSGGATVSTLASDSVTFAVSLGNTAIALTNNGAVLASMNVTAGCGANSTVVSGICQATATPWWPPTTIAPVGTKVLTANEIANSVTEVGSPAWQTLVRDGTIKFVDTGLIMTGYSTRPIVFAYYKRPVGDGMTWCTRPVYKDDGSAVGASTYTGFGCNTEEISWERGTDSGVIRHYPNGNRCWQLGWNQSTLSFDETLVTCP
jgi:hypothetical protein